MPKPLFYSGVVFCAFLALVGATQSSQYLDWSLGTATEFPPNSQDPRLLVLLLFTIVPVMALFLRMASLIAARNLFSSFFAASGIAITAFTFGFLAIVRLRSIMLLRDARMLEADAAQSALSATLQLQAALLYALGFSLCVSFYALRPYFSMHARLLSGFATLPGVLYTIFLTQLFVPAESSVRWHSAFAFTLLISGLLLGIAAHCLGHRHLFLEVTNLRELLDSRIDIASRRGRKVGINGNVAFDS